MAPSESFVANNDTFNMDLCYKGDGYGTIFSSEYRSFLISNAVVNSIVSLVSSVANGLVIISTCLSQEISVTEMLDFSLALPDFLTSTFGAALITASSVLMIQGKLYCELAKTEVFVISFLGCWSLLSVSTTVADRFLSIFHPYRYEDLTIVKRVWPGVAIAVSVVVALCLAGSYFISSALPIGDILVSGVVIIHVVFGCYTYGRILLRAISINKRTAVPFPQDTEESQKEVPKCLAAGKNSTENIPSQKIDQPTEGSMATVGNVQGVSRTQGTRMDQPDHIEVIPHQRRHHPSSNRREITGALRLFKTSKRSAVLFLSELILILPLGISVFFIDRLTSISKSVIIGIIYTWVSIISIVDPIIYFWSMRAKRATLIRRLRLLLHMNR